MTLYMYIMYTSGMMRFVGNTYMYMYIVHRGVYSAMFIELLNFILDHNKCVQCICRNQN